MARSSLLLPKKCKYLKAIHEELAEKVSNKREREGDQFDLTKETLVWFLLPF